MTALVSRFLRSLGDCRRGGVRLRCSSLAGLALGVAVLAATGCDRGPQVAPVTGVVKYRGKPLEFGTVTFQAQQGQPARGNIQPDGSFTLSTFREGDGAMVGLHQVRVTCYESQRPSAGTAAAGEQSLGKLLIPQKYTFFDRSGLTADVKAGQDNTFVFELTD